MEDSKACGEIHEAPYVLTASSNPDSVPSMRDKIQSELTDCILLYILWGLLENNSVI